MGSVVSPALIVRRGNTPWGAFGMGELQFLLCALNLIVIPLECDGLSGVFFFSQRGKKLEGRSMGDSVPLINLAHFGLCQTNWPEVVGQKWADGRKMSKRVARSFVCARPHQRDETGRFSSRAWCLVFWQTTKWRRPRLERVILELFRKTSGVRHSPLTIPAPSTLCCSVTQVTSTQLWLIALC